MVVSSLLLPAALAAGRSADIELVLPSFSTGSVPGVDSPLVGEDEQWRIGGFGQYAENPLVLYDLGESLGPVVRHRSTAVVGVSYALSPRAAVRLTLPAIYQTGTWVPEYGADGAGAGDLSARVRVAPVKLRYLDAGARFGVDLPTGTSEAWMGEEGLRSTAALLLRPHVGPVALLVDVGATARTAVDTEADFALGSELGWGSALQGEVWSERAWVFGGVVGRSGFSSFLQGGAENAAEALGGVQLAFGKAFDVDLGYGKGLTEGYGTSEQRYFGALVWEPQPREPEPVFVEVEEPEESWLPPPEPEPEEEEGPPPWEPEELARVVDEVIEIRDPIQFEFATSNILPESLPVLVAVGELMLAEERLEHVVVEGHASEEGSHDFNYELSTDRARAVWEELLKVGVHADRVSFRGLGEVVPRTAGEEEEELAENRRVEFHIVRQLDPLELVPPHDRRVPLPWEKVEP